MIDVLLRTFVKSCLALRYRIRVRGREALAARGRSGILFLPNHPALIDPIIVASVLHKTFRPRFLADQDQIDRFFIRYLARRAGARAIPDVAKHGPGAAQKVQRVLARCIEDLRGGRNLLLYPAGHVYRRRCEDLRGNSAVETILRELPDIRVVLIRTTGLWGSMFSWASGRAPDVGACVRRAGWGLLAGGVLFSPRRRVTIELHEPDDLPRTADRETLNRYLEAFYNAETPPNTFVPYTPWDRGGVREAPEPSLARMAGGAEFVPQATRRTVLDQLRDLTDKGDIADDDQLARDLGLDSLDKADLVVWLGTEFGFGEVDTDALQTVADVMLAAAGEAIAAGPPQLKPISPRWFAAAGAGPADLPDGATLTEVFLNQARRGPGRPAATDQAAGVKTYRDIVLRVMLLRRKIAELPGGRIGIMLPAGVAADVTYLATLLAGKTPVMLNWTVGPRNALHALDLTGAERVLTARALVERLAASGTDLAALAGRFVYLEDVSASISTAAKGLAWVRSRLSWRALARAPVPETAVILFTSGSESLPKAVPLTHANILANIRDVAALDIIRRDDVLLGMLPPFHSFGLTVGMMLPMCFGVRVAHHPNPTDAAALAAIADACRTTILVGTPTFLGGIVRAAGSGALAEVRLIITGAERCPEALHTALAERCPNAVVLEGYGLTECSPVVSINRPDEARRGAIGRPMPSVTCAVVNVETGEPVAPGEAGMLLVAGPSVFAGYLHYDGPSPFVDFGGRSWYRTGDLVRRDDAGVLTFVGRLKRFVKLGGEMISLPAVEGVLAEQYRPRPDEGPSVAVDAAGDEAHPELVLFTTRPLRREEVNRRIRDAGLSPLHNIRRVVRVEEIPLLGTGKTDYRKLRASLDGPPG